MAQTTVNIRMDQELKDEVERVCDEMGMSMSTAFKIFAKRLAHDREMPFSVKAVYPPWLPVVNTWEELVEMVDEGLGDVRAGRVYPFEELFVEMDAKYGL